MDLARLEQSAKELERFWVDSYWVKQARTIGLQKLYKRIKDSPVQKVSTPNRLCEEMIGKLREFTDLKGKRVLVFNVEFLPFTLEAKDVWFYADCEAKRNYVRAFFPHVNVWPGWVGEGIVSWNLEKIMKFDVVVMNPPYQTKSDKDDRKTQAIWPGFVAKAFDICKDSGYVAAVHPSGWRNFNGSFSNTGNLLKSKQINHLEINSIEAGLKTFGVQTSYDWYVAQNCPNHSETTVKDQYGEIATVDLKVPFIPNGMLEKVMSLIAKDGEEKCQTIYSRSMYGSDKDNMKDEETGDFTYPCIYSILKGGTINLWYSNTNKDGHFGIPKVIWSNGSASVAIVDDTGEYGLTQFAYAIVDAPKNLEGIAKALNSGEFKKINKMCNFTGTPGNPFASHNVFSLFRKDFWREFVPKETKAEWWNKTGESK